MPDRFAFNRIRLNQQPHHRRSISFTPSIQIQLRHYCTLLIAHSLATTTTRAKRRIYWLFSDDNIKGIVYRRLRFQLLISRNSKALKIRANSLEILPFFFSFLLISFIVAASGSVFCFIAHCHKDRNSEPVSVCGCVLRLANFHRGFEMSIIQFQMAFD